MKIYEKKEIPSLVRIKCDACKKEYSIDDIYEIQEFIHIKNHCGYGSVFGDGMTLDIDLCQHCMNEIIQIHCGDPTKYLREIEVYE